MLELFTVLICGIGTFLLRFLPLWRARHPRTDAHGLPAPQNRHRTQRFFAGIGPAALTALLLVSVWPFLHQDTPRLAAAAAALLALALVKRLTRGGVAAPTLAAAAVYGVLMHLSTEM